MDHFCEVCAWHDQALELLLGSGGAGRDAGASAKQKWRCRAPSGTATGTRPRADTAASLLTRASAGEAQGGAGKLKNRAGAASTKRADHS